MRPDASQNERYRYSKRPRTWYTSTHTLGRGAVPTGGRVLHRPSLGGGMSDDLPVEQSSTFEWVVNLSTAQALGIAIRAEFAAYVGEWVR